MQSSVSIHDPYALAESNADYAFKFAKQFPLQQRFLLVFVYHSWLGGLSNNVNFADHTAVYMRAMARRTFLQFQHDRNTMLFGQTRAEASRLLSGLLFLDAWQNTPDRSVGRLYLNPRAKTPLSDLDKQHLQIEDNWLWVDDFAHDNY